MRKILGGVLSLSIYLSMALPVFAAQINVCAGTGQGSKLCELGATNIGPVIGTIINVAFILAVIIALIYLVIGGIKWIMSGGDKSAVETARENIIAAIIGLIIVFLSYFIINLLVSIFIGGSINSLELPSLLK